MNPKPYPTVSRHRFSLFSQLALTFLLMLGLLATVYGYLTVTLVNRYFEATHQRLNREVAAHIVKFMAPFNQEGVNRKGAEAIFFQAMVTNPSVEVYLLDSLGRVELYHADDGQIKRHQVDIAPVREYIQNEGAIYIKGDNPRDEQKQTIFSAASVFRNGRLQGYVYVILTSSVYGSVMGLLRQNYVIQWGVGTLLITLLAALAIGLLAVYRLTKNLRHVIERVQQFQMGDFSTRIRVEPASELAVLADTFNNMAETLTRNIDQLQQAEQLRRNLVATVSHDLRTPLAAIHGYSETLVLKNTLPEDQKKEYAGIILQSTRKLIKLVAELFELSKLEAHETVPHREPFVLAELVMEVFAKCRLLAQHKQIAFTCENCQLSTPCFADVGMLERVIQNLIENAIRYAPSDTFVRIELVQEPTTLTVHIDNAMAGLTDPIRAYLLGSSPDGNLAERPTGAGLGLVIVRKILDLHHSQLVANQPTTQTIRFTFSLPVYQPSA
ncbi:ATP-binding protein [Spirosoma migulaei]